jgi:hypothetical protein
MRRGAGARRQRGPCVRLSWDWMATTNSPPRTLSVMVRRIRVRGAVLLNKRDLCEDIPVRVGGVKPSPARLRWWRFARFTTMPAFSSAASPPRAKRRCCWAVQAPGNRRSPTASLAAICWTPARCAHPMTAAGTPPLPGGCSRCRAVGRSSTSRDFARLDFCLALRRRWRACSPPSKISLAAAGSAIALTPSSPDAPSAVEMEPAS